MNDHSLNGVRGASFNTKKEAQASILAKAVFYIDDHDGRRKNVDSLVFSNGRICPAMKNTVFCLNGLYVGPEGLPHLSKWSASGVIDSRDKSLHEAVEKYNSNRENDCFCAELLLTEEALA